LKKGSSRKTVEETCKEKIRRKISLLAGLVILISLLGFVSGVLYTQYIFKEAFYTTWIRLAKSELACQKNKYPSLKPAFNIAENLLSTPDPRDQFSSKPGISALVSPSEWRAATVGPQISHDRSDLEEIVVGSTDGLIGAIRDAQPGDVITISLRGNTPSPEIPSLSTQAVWTPRRSKSVPNDLALSHCGLICRRDSMSGARTGYSKI